jgi:hypothetical protein
MGWGGGPRGGKSTRTAGCTDRPSVSQRAQEVRRFMITKYIMWTALFEMLRPAMNCR